MCYLGSRLTRDGGAANRVATFVLGNDGGTLLVLVDRDAGTSNVEELAPGELADAVDRVRHYLDGPF